MNFDISLVLKRATDILFLRNPLGTAMGVLGGIASHGLVVTIWAYEQLHIAYYVVGGIFLFNLPAFLKSSSRSIEPEIENTFDVIDGAVERGEFSKVHARSMYKQAVNSYLEEKFSGKGKKKTVKKERIKNGVSTITTEERGD